jgi:hypothetical protein
LELVPRNVRHKRCPHCGKRRRWWKCVRGSKWAWTKVEDRWLCYVCVPPWLDQQDCEAHWAILRREEDDIWKLEYEASCGHVDVEGGSAGHYRGRRFALEAFACVEICVRCWMDRWLELGEKMKKMDELIEQVAEIIYRHKGGVAPDEYEAVIGEKQKEWKTDAPWDTNPDELCEHERDEYRTQARAVLDHLRQRGYLF